MKRQLKFYIKERNNPQTGTYYVRSGQMTDKEARDAASPIYGHNTMHGFDTEARMEARIAELTAQGERIL